MVFIVTSSNPKIKIARSSEFYLHQVEEDLEINIRFENTSFLEFPDLHLRDTKIVAATKLSG